MRHPAIASVLILFLGSAVSAWQGGAVVGAPASKYKLMRSVSGSKSSETKAGYHINDPRSTFYLPEDTKVIVYMEWEGSPGKHTFEAYWRNPAGKVSVVSDFAYETRPSEKRYSGYMQLNLSPSMQTGLWSMEARIDGEILGTHTFELISAAKPEIREETRMTLALGEVYARANGATATIEALDASGKVFRPGLGFFIRKDALVTAFQVIDGATKVRIKTAGGEQLVDEVLAADRWQDWAVLPVDNGTPLPKSPSAAAVGDRYTTLTVDTNGNRSVVDATVVGKTQAGKNNERLKIASSIVLAAIGAPVLNEYGEVTAFVGGTPLPGSRSIIYRDTESNIWTVPGNVLGTNLITNSSDQAIPIERVVESGAPLKFADLLASGSFTVPLTSRIRVGRGSLCKSLSKGPMPQPNDEKFEFSRTDTLNVYMQWYPSKKDKALGTVKVLDADNVPVPGAELKAQKISVNPQQTEITTWKLPLAQFKAGVYRVDVLLDDAPVWRSYFRVVP